MGFNKMSAQEGLAADEYKHYADKAQNRKFSFLALSGVLALCTAYAGYKFDFWDQVFSPANDLSEISVDAWASVGTGTLLTAVMLGTAGRYQYYESAIRKNENVARSGQKTAQDAAAILSLRR